MKHRAPPINPTLAPCWLLAAGPGALPAGDAQPATGVGLWLGVWRVGHRRPKRARRLFFCWMGLRCAPGRFLAGADTRMKISTLLLFLRPCARWRWGSRTTRRSPRKFLKGPSCGGSRLGWCFFCDFCRVLGDNTGPLTDPELKHWQELAAAVPVVRDVPVLRQQKRERIWAARVT